MRAPVPVVCALALLVPIPLRAGEKAVYQRLLTVARDEAKLGLTSLAAETYREALALPVREEDLTGGYLELGGLLAEQLGDSAGALDSYLRAISCSPKGKRTDEALYQAGILLEGMGRCYHAVDYFERLIVEFPESAFRDRALAASERCFQKNFPELAAVVGGVPITKMELDGAIEAMPAAYRERYATPEGRKGLLDTMVEKRLIALYARDTALLDSEEVRGELQEARDRILGETFEAQEVRAQVTVNDEEVAAYYAEHKEEYKKPEEIRLRHIMAEDLEKAQKALEELNRGVPFAKVAKEYSTDTRSRDRGGDLGFITRGQLPKELEDAAFGLEIGQTSGIVGSKFGQHILQVEDRRPAMIRPLEEVKDLIQAEVRRKKEEARRAEILAELQTKYGVKTYLEEQVSPSPETPPAAGTKEEQPPGSSGAQPSAPEPGPR